MKRLLLAPIAAALAFGLANPPAAFAADEPLNPCADRVLDTVNGGPAGDWYGTACWTGGQYGVFGVFDGKADGLNVEVIGHYAGGTATAQTHKGLGWGAQTIRLGPLPLGSYVTVTIQHPDGSGAKSQRFKVTA